MQSLVSRGVAVCVALGQLKTIKPVLQLKHTEISKLFAGCLEVSADFQNKPLFWSAPTRKATYLQPATSSSGNILTQDNLISVQEERNAGQYAACIWNTSTDGESDDI